MTSRLFYFLALVCLFGVFVLVGCNTDNKKFEEFYFHSANLDDGLVYYYEAVDIDNAPPEVWFYKTLYRGGSAYLIGQAYGPAFEVKQLVVEHLSPKGAILDSVYLFLPDSSGVSKMIRGSLTNRAVFPFYESGSSEAIKQKVSWTDPADSLEYTLEKQRRFDKRSQDRKSILFDISYSLETFAPELGATNSEWSGHEEYTLGVGLTSYSREFGETKMVYRLTNRYTMEDFIRLME